MIIVIVAKKLHFLKFVRALKCQFFCYISFPVFQIWQPEIDNSKVKNAKFNTFSVIYAKQASDKVYKKFQRLAVDFWHPFVLQQFT